MYEKSEEVHYQRAYPEEIITKMIKEAGLELLAVYDAYTMETPEETSGRLTYIARECRKHTGGKNE